MCIKIQCNLIIFISQKMKMFLNLLKPNKIGLRKNIIIITSLPQTSNLLPHDVNICCAIYISILWHLHSFGKNWSLYLKLPQVLDSYYMKVWIIEVEFVYI